MSDEKLDLILNVVSDIRAKVNSVSATKDKSEIQTKSESESVGAVLDRLEKEIIQNRIENLYNRRKIREVEMRLTKLENHVGITN